MKFTKKILENLYKYELKEKMYAEHGEEGVLEYLFDHIEQTSKFCLDLGAGNSRWNPKIGSENTAFLIEKYNWDFLLIDKTPEHHPLIKSEWIRQDNIIKILSKYKCKKEIELLSIDLDGNDYWILKSILESNEYKFKIILLEFNPNLKYNESFAAPNRDNFVKDGSIFYGASLLAYTNLLLKYGYKLIHVMKNPSEWWKEKNFHGLTGRNAIFIDEIYIEDDINIKVKDLHPITWKENYKKNVNCDWIKV